MRCYYLIVLCLLLKCVSTEPDPKKYKPEKEDNDKQDLTKDERKFLREVEEKFGVKSTAPIEVESDKIEKDNEGSKNNTTDAKPNKLFPAVIAIEIFNDTDTKSKGKRTIDANLGYGYRTNNGYKYSYFGKPSHDKGKFMIYPYSQHDIPSHGVHSSKYSSPDSGYSSHATSVEIQPSQAFELVQVKDQQSGYDYQVPSNPLKTKYEDFETETPSQTLYTTYDGQEFSGLSGQFPSLMPNYFVDPTQLLKNPQYQNVGLTQDHLRTQNTYINQNQRIVPVLVLRVPSSYLKNPTAELYADLPNNYPLSQHINSVNLQELVNQYFKKNGYPFAPKIMSYQSSPLSAHSDAGHYSNPYARPAYTQSDYSGINYSGVKPVMAKYPASYSHQQYVSQPQAVYEHPSQQQYQYQYVYEPQTDTQAQSYYHQTQYVQQTNPETHAYQHQIDEHQASPQDASLGYAESQSNGPNTNSAYESHSEAHQTGGQATQYASPSPAANYEIHEETASKETPSSEYGPVKVDIPAYSSSSQYYPSQQAQKETVSVLPSELIHSENYQVNPSSGAVQYSYDTQARGASLTGPSENYPSKDHTIAAVYPYQKQPQTSVQSVSYVTPIPSSKYQAQYRVMVPQTVLGNPNSPKSANLHYLQQSQYGQGAASELSYRGTHSHSPSSQKHPQTYYTYSKRMAKPERKPSRKPLRKPIHVKTSS